MPALSDTNVAPTTEEAPQPLATISQDISAGSRTGGVAADNIQTTNTSTSAFQINTNLMLPPSTENNETMDITVTNSRSSTRIQTSKRKNSGAQYSVPEFDEEEDDTSHDDAAQTPKSLPRKNVTKYSKLEEVNKTLKEDVKHLYSLVQILENKINSLQIQVNNIPPAPPIVEIPVHTPLFSDLFKTHSSNKTPIQSPEERNLFHAVRVEQLDCASRENNILLMGIPCPHDTLSLTEKLESDDATVRKLFTSLELDPRTIKSWQRFRKTPNSRFEPIIKVTLHNKEHVRTALRSSSKLRQMNQTRDLKIYMNPDLTPTQRASEKELIANRKYANDNLETSCPFYFGIRDGVLKKINKKQQN